MGEYSVYGKKVDNVVRKHMDLIINEIKNKIPEEQIVSILAIGGLGRGEGSFLVDSKIYPLNDYDIYLITKSKVDFSILKDISYQATKKIMKKSKFSFSKSSNLMEFYVDLRNLTLGELERAEALLKYYEIRESAKVIYGRDVRKLIPPFSLDDIPFEEGLRFLLNRMSLLIESFNINTLNSAETKKTVLYYIGKNYMSCAEALLLLNKKFVCSYKERALIFKNCYKKSFPDLYRKIPDLAEKILFFTNNKLKPSKKFLSSSPIKYWLQAREDMLKVTNFYIKEAFNLQAKDEIELSEQIKKLNKSFLKNYLKLFLSTRYPFYTKDFFLRFLSIFGRIYFNYLYYKRNLKLNNKRNFKILFSQKDINIRIYSLCPLVLFSLDNNLNLNKKNFKLAKLNLKTLTDISHINNWEDLRRKYSDIFRIYQFLKA